MLRTTPTKPPRSPVMTHKGRNSEKRTRNITLSATSPTVRRAPEQKGGPRPRSEISYVEAKNMGNIDHSRTAAMDARSRHQIESPSAENQIPIQKAEAQLGRKPSNASLPAAEKNHKNLMIAAPPNGSSHFGHLHEFINQEVADQEQNMKLMSNDPRLAQAGKKKARPVSDRTNIMSYEKKLLIGNSKTAFSAIQEYRFASGDPELASSPPTEAQLKACEKQRKENDPEYVLYDYYLKHRNNKPGVLHSRHSIDFVEYGVLSSLVEKDKRHDSTKIYSAGFIEEVIGQFKKEGANVIMTGEGFLKYACRYGFAGRPDPSPGYPSSDGELFATENASIEKIMAMVGPDPSSADIAKATEEVLGLPNCKGEVLVHIYIPPGALENARIANGTEHGANHLWIMGATTPKGNLELVADRVNMRGVPGTDPAETAPTVKILGPLGKDIEVCPGNYLSIGEKIKQIQMKNDIKGEI